MQYLGGKTRLAKEIAAHLEALAAPINATIEDRFCGALSVAAAIKHRPLICSDANAALICTLRAVQGGWVPPLDLSEEAYRELKQRNDSSDPLTAFAASGCSFGAESSTSTLHTAIRSATLQSVHSTMMSFGRMPRRRRAQESSCGCRSTRRRRAGNRPARSARCRSWAAHAARNACVRTISSNFRAVLSARFRVAAAELKMIGGHVDGVA